MNEDELNEKQKRFAEEYVIDLNITRSYKRVYQVDDDGVAGAAGSRLLKDVKVSAYVKKLQDEIQDRSKVKADDVINELAKIAFSDISRVFTTDNGIKHIVHIDQNDTAAIQSVEVNEWKEQGETMGETKKLKMYDKIRALEALGKHFGIFEKDNSQKKDATVTIFQLPDNGRK